MATTMICMHHTLVEKTMIYNTNILIGMHGNRFTLNDNNTVVPSNNGDDKPMTIQAAQRQINVILVKCNIIRSIKEFTDQAKCEYDAFFCPKQGDCVIVLPL